MEISLAVAAIVGVISGLTIMIFGWRKKGQNVGVFDDVGGAVKEDWARTGKIDFQVSDPDSASPQAMILRVEERKLVVSAMGQQMAQLRWRLAALEEAKELVVCWNRTRSAKADERDVLSVPVLSLARDTGR
jgi:hypothetical protein